MHADRGMTLIEVLVALAIVAIALSTGIKAAGGLATNAERLAAIQKAQATMEAELRGEETDRDRDDEQQRQVAERALERFRRALKLSADPFRQVRRRDVAHAAKHGAKRRAAREAERAAQFARDLAAAFQTATIIGPALGGLLYVLGAGVAYCAVAALVIPAFVRPAPRLVWNASASVPAGLYSARPSVSVKRGDLVAVHAPAPIARRSGSSCRTTPARSAACCARTSDARSISR